MRRPEVQPSKRTATVRARRNALCGGKRFCSFAHHVDVPGIGKEAISLFPRDFFDNTKPHEMVQRTGDSWNGEFQGFGGSPNANVWARLHEFMEAQRRGSSPPKFLYLVLVFGKQLQRPLCGVCRLLCRRCN